MTKMDKNEKKNRTDEKKAKELALDLANKLENNTISLAEMAKAIDDFLINQKDGED